VSKLKDTPDGQLSLTDSDARSMATSGRGTGVVGYNVQIAVDTRHHMIVAHEVTNAGHDRTMLRVMAEQARDAIGKDDLIAIADRGYYKSEEIAACEQEGIRTLVPKTVTPGHQRSGQFDKKDFRYIAETDEYECPAGERAIWRFAAIEHGLAIHKYWSSACPQCVLRSRCTSSKYRRIRRWESEAILDAMQLRLDQAPQAMRVRRQTVEHPFGTFKAWMGTTHFLTKTLPKVSTEMSLQVFAYNLKRMIRIFGMRTLLGVIGA
jgi:hypothetical protein